MLDRRQFCRLVGRVSCLTALGQLAFGQALKTKLRVIAYNVYKCTGWPGNRPLARQAVKLGQIPRRLADELALYEPDIINFSESPDESVVKEIADRLGMNYVFFPSGQNWSGALLTRFEIARSKNCPIVGGERPKDLFTRHWAWLRSVCQVGSPLSFIRPICDREPNRRSATERFQKCSGR